MAEASPLQHHLTCCVCFNIYRNPSRLACMHMFCLECIDQLQTQAKVPCPECRQVCDRKEVKKDFKTQEIIDVLNQTAQVRGDNIQGAVLEKCDMCDKSGQLITSKCSQCDQYMCHACEKYHRGSAATKHHLITSTQNILEPIHVDLTKTLETLQKALKDNSLNSERLINKKRELNKQKQEQVRLLDNYQKEWRQEMEKHFSEMCNKISEANDRIIENCTILEELYKNNDKEFSSQIEIINDLINTKDTTLLKSANIINDEVKQNIKEIERKLSENIIPDKFPVTVKRGNKWDHNTGPHVIVNPEFPVTAKRENKLDHNTGPHVMVNSDAHSQREDVSPTYWVATPVILQNTYKRDKTIKLNDYPERMCFVHDDIWTVDDGDNITTYDYDLNLINTMRVKGKVCSITYDQLNDQVITAHGCDRGLHQYDLKGRHIQQICTGYYVDVIFHNRKLYALSDIGVLQMFTFRDNHWSKGSQIRLLQDKVKYVDRLCIIGNSIHASSWRNHCIYTFSLKSGQLQHTVGKHRKAGASGDLSHPYISGCFGETGDILVADKGNNRLQVYSSTNNEWSVVRLQGMQLQWPQQALVDQHVDNIWVLSGSTHQLIKYTKSN